MSATCYVVTLHDGGGSMVEAADSRYAFGLFTDHTRAAAAADQLSDAISFVSEVHRSEWWATIQEVELPGAATGSWVGNLSPEECTAEIERIIDEEQKRWDADL